MSISSVSFTWSISSMASIESVWSISFIWLDWFFAFFALVGLIALVRLEVVTLFVEFAYAGGIDRLDVMCIILSYTGGVAR